MARRKRAGGDSPKTRAELYEIAEERDLPGRSKMGRDELARVLGYKLGAKVADRLQGSVGGFPAGLLIRRRWTATSRW